jgi:NADH-quinone oxidoreductase subunit L
MLTHAIFKASLFFARGVLIHNMGRAQDFRSSLGFGERVPTISLFGAITTLCLVGFPFSVGFYSKDLILDLFVGKTFNLILQPLITFVVFLTIIYMFRFCYLLF